MAEGIGGIVDDQIISGLLSPQEPKPVVVIYLHPRILQGAGHLGEELPRHVHEHLIDFHHVDMLHGIILQKLLSDPAVSAADDQDVLYMGMDRHGNMGHHLVVNKLILFGKYDLSV